MQVNLLVQLHREKYNLSKPHKTMTLKLVQIPILSIHKILNI